MAHSNDRKAVSQFPQPPRRYYHNCATDRPTPPPPPPTTDAYCMFGREYVSDDVEPTLEQVGRRRLYDPSQSTTDELRRLNKILLQLFLRLVQSLCTPPPQPPETAPHEKLLRDIEDVFVNMQYLINSMRPSQAAIDLKVLLDKQTKSRKALSSRLRDVVSQAQKLVTDAANDLSKPSVQMSSACLATLDALPTTSDSPQDHLANSSHSQETSSAIADTFDDENSDIDDPDAFVSRVKPSQDQLLLQIAQIVSNPNLG